MPWLSSLRGMGMVNPLRLSTDPPSLGLPCTTVCWDRRTTSLRSMVGWEGAAGWTGRSSEAPSGPVRVEAQDSVSRNHAPRQFV